MLFVLAGRFQEAEQWASQQPNMPKGAWRWADDRTLLGTRNEVVVLLGTYRSRPDMNAMWRLLRQVDAIVIEGSR